MEHAGTGVGGTPRSNGSTCEQRDTLTQLKKIFRGCWGEPRGGSLLKTWTSTYTPDQGVPSLHDVESVTQGQGVQIIQGGY